jgi:hypothetical protein
MRNGIFYETVELDSVILYEESENGWTFERNSSLPCISFLVRKVESADGIS